MSFGLSSEDTTELKNEVQKTKGYENIQDELRAATIVCAEEMSGQSLKGALDSYRKEFTQEELERLKEAYEFLRANGLEFTAETLKRECLLNL